MDDVRGEVPLTEREGEIVRLLRRGLSRGEVAERMGIAYPTVRTHLRSVFGKLGVRNTTGAVCVLERRRARKLARDIREATRRYWEAERVRESERGWGGSEDAYARETERSIIALLVSFIDHPEVAEAVKEWEDS